MPDWETLADFGTAAGTIVLAAATFVAVRASALSTRIAERALLTGQRPLLTPAGPEDATDTVQFAGGEVFKLSSGQALVRIETDVIYLAIPLVNEGSGPAVLRGYRLEGETESEVALDPYGAARHLRGEPAPAAASFSVQQRDLLISTRRPGFWQAALRDPNEPRYQEVHQAVETRGRITVDVLYGDHEGGQPTATKFVLLPQGDAWRCDAVRYWNLQASKDLRQFGFR